MSTFLYSWSTKMNSQLALQALLARQQSLASWIINLVCGCKYACLHLSGCFLQIHLLWWFYDSAISGDLDLHVRWWSWGGFIPWVVFCCCRCSPEGNLVSEETVVATVNSTVFCLHVERSWCTARGSNLGWSPVSLCHLHIDMVANLYGWQRVGSLVVIGFLRCLEMCRPGHKAVLVDCLWLQLLAGGWWDWVKLLAHQQLGWGSQVVHWSIAILENAEYSTEAIRLSLVQDILVDLDILLNEATGLWIPGAGGNVFKVPSHCKNFELFSDEPLSLSTVSGMPC